MLTICTWLWGNKYSVEDVSRLHRALTRNHKTPFRFLVVTDNPEPVQAVGLEATRIPVEDKKLSHRKGCFARLRMFDPAWQQANKIEERLACVDLDVVVTRELDVLFDRPERFVIFQGANATNPCPFNGSLMMLRPGSHPEVWSEFSLEKAAKVPWFQFPDDQSWLHHMVPQAAAWHAGPRSGVYAFRKREWPRDTVDLPADARLVAFPGWRSPEQFQHVKWVREHWK